MRRRAACGGGAGLVGRLVGWWQGAEASWSLAPPARCRDPWASAVSTELRMHDDDICIVWGGKDQRRVEQGRYKILVGGKGHAQRPRNASVAQQGAPRPSFPHLRVPAC